MNKKKQLLNNLKYDTYCRIGISKIHGVGVIAIKKIPKGTNPFMLTNKKGIKYDLIELSKKEIDRLPKNVKKIVTDFIAIDDNGNYPIPYNGPNSLDPSFYMNHNDKNNIDLIETKSEMLEFIANRDIEEGEELTINYKDYE
ncbi:SET domain protein [Klosneuvirus KNV1]|uniref:SET domain protein n=1 Tax=Klosneuvirus KNV1 TaxID=1977640 RepID=A0A1V0SHQ6_9VIRU|nr:SET domain protein [Klosneuvirus KNV1]